MAYGEAREAELWNRYVDHRDPAARDSLFELYLPWATAVGRSVHRRVRAYSVDRDDFVQNAQMGLLEAMSRYDPGRGIAFQAFATRRVRGAVFNGLKAILRDRPAPRDESRYRARLESIQQSEGEVSAFGTVVDSIVDLGLGFLLDEMAYALDIPSTNDGYVYARTSETERRLAVAIEQLPERLALIIKQHYFQQVQFQEIAIAFGVTKGRVSQLHRSGLERLRALLYDLP